MTTDADVRKISQPFLTRNREFRYRKREIFRHPIQHMWTGFFIDRLSSARDVRTSWFAGVLFGPPPSFVAGIGNMIDGASGSLDDPAFAEQFLENLEQVTVELFPQIDTLRGLLRYTWVPFLGTGKSPISKALLHTALGEFEAAESILSEWVHSEEKHLQWNAARIAQYYKKGSKGWQRQQRSQDALVERLSELATLLELISGSKCASIASLLHRWETLSVQERGVLRYWEPSPFPFELA
ncbi:hypothetical protein VE26_08330 [Devosia chinhatensis]|uniref:Uncharacterized protein n=1 Tax=Devosia chinhatensis TaxID=429727 RepID=A0A0F5FNR7_9HYPH|nr:hypothetical protein VE26_08330 [Devosia chinhatensis]